MLGGNRQGGAAFSGEVEQRARLSRRDQAMRLTEAEGAAVSGIEAHMGKRIATRRGLHGWSVQALAARSGLPVMRLQAYEAGLRRVIPPDLIRLCQALDVLPSYFLDGLTASGDDPDDTP